MNTLKVSLVTLVTLILTTVFAQNSSLHLELHEVSQYLNPQLQNFYLQENHYDYGQIVPPPAPTPVRRHVVVSGFIYLTDHETFGSNEHGSAEGRAETVLTQDLPQHVLYLEGRAGGEMRVELSLSAQARASGDVIISGQAVLFEGTSEQTTDRDGDEYFELLIPRDGFTSHRVVVRNEDEGDDYAEITLNFSNYYAP